MCKIEIKEILEVLPSTTSLIFVDYNDTLNDNLKEVAKCVQDNNYDVLYEKVDVWYEQGKSIALAEYKKNLLHTIMLQYDLSFSEADGIMDKYYHEIEDTIYNRADDTPVLDLIRNTSGFTWYYDLSHYIEQTIYLGQEDVDEIIFTIMEDLKMVYSKKVYNDLLTMLSQASYGGNLVIYFYTCFENLIHRQRNNKVDWVETYPDGKEFDFINFKGYYLCVNDQVNGSGDYCFIEQELKLPFDRTKLRLCKLDNYSYTYNVCGMTSDWCGETNMTLTTV